MSATVDRRDFLKGAGALVVGFSLHGVAHGAAAARRREGDRQDARRRTTSTASSPSTPTAASRSTAARSTSGRGCASRSRRWPPRSSAARSIASRWSRATPRSRPTRARRRAAPASCAAACRSGRRPRPRARRCIGLAAEKLGKPRGDLEVANHEVRPKSGGAGVRFGELVGDRRFGIKVDAKAPLKDPATYTVVGKSLPRPDVPGKVTGAPQFVHDIVVDGMLHGAVVRPPRDRRDARRRRRVVDPLDPRRARRAHQGFPRRRRAYEWDAMSAARALKARWTGGDALVGDAGVRAWMKRGPVRVRRVAGEEGRREGGARRRGEAPVRRVLLADAVARVDGAVVRDRRRARRQGDDLDARRRRRTASARRSRGCSACRRPACASIYLDGAGCYGMNGHDDAAADAALLSRAVGKPVRVQWTREDELGWDPKGPPQLLALEGALGDDGKIAAWRTEMWLPKATAQLPNMPLLGPEAAGMRADAGHLDRPHQPERQSAVRGRAPGRRRALAQGRAAAPVEPARAGQDRQRLRGRELHRRARRGRRPRRARVPARGTVRSARHRGGQARRGADRLARARRRPGPAASGAASPTCTTRTTRPTSRWRWRSKSTGAPARSACAASAARTTAGSSSTRTR